MLSRTLTILAALALSAGTALAQDGLDAPRTGFYADPVLPDPAPVPLHVYPASDATSAVAMVTPAAALAQTPQHPAGCNARSPCAVVSPPARG
jgi:hypothetical protein